MALFVLFLVLFFFVFFSRLIFAFHPLLPRRAEATCLSTGRLLMEPNGGSVCPGRSGGAGGCEEARGEGGCKPMARLASRCVRRHCEASFRSHNRSSEADEYSAYDTIRHCVPQKETVERACLCKDGYRARELGAQCMHAGALHCAAVIIAYHDWVGYAAWDSYATRGRQRERQQMCRPVRCGARKIGGPVLCCTPCQLFSGKEGCTDCRGVDESVVGCRAALVARRYYL